MNKYIKYPLTKESIIQISKIKKEPKWVLDFRLKAFNSFLKQKDIKFGISLKELDINKINYYITQEISQDEKVIPQEQIDEFNNIGVPISERYELSGISRQYNSEVIYTRLKKRLEEKGIIFLSIENGIKQYPEIVKKYMSTVVNIGDNKYNDLNSAFFSGGSFVYIPKNIKLELPIETYFRINAKEFGQFERTLIIAEENSSVNYIEGCTAPQYTSNNLHCGVVEIIAKKNSNVTYTTLQNWSKNVFNLVTKRGIAHENAHISWIDCNIGSKVTMKYPSVILKGNNSSGELLSLALTESKQKMDTGGKMIHIGTNTKSIIRSKTIVNKGGINNYRGLTKILKQAKDSRGYIECESLILDDISISNTYPQNYINNNSSYIEHEAYISNISEEKMNYLRSKGLNETQSKDLIIQGFSQDIINILPDEYSIELKRILNSFIK